MVRYFSSPRFAADVIATILGAGGTALATLTVQGPARYLIAGGAVALLLFFVGLRLWGERAQQAREDAIDTSLAAANAGISAGSATSEQYFRDLLSRAPLKDLERRALQLATDLSEITGRFVEGESKYTLRMHTFESLQDYPKEIENLGYTRDQTIEEFGRLELATMKAYRDGNFAQKISALVREFDNDNIHDPFTDAFRAPERAGEPYRIITFRDALYRLAANSSGKHLGD